MKRWKWKVMKWRERILWCLGLLAVDPYSGGLRKALFWRVLASAVQGDWNKRVSDAKHQSSAELDELKRTLSEVVPKLVRISLDKSPSPERFRLVVDLDPYMIRNSFQWGNDDKAIQYFAEYVGHHVYRELRTHNLQRFTPEGRFGSVKYGGL